MHNIVGVPPKQTDFIEPISSPTDEQWDKLVDLMVFFETCGYYETTEDRCLNVWYEITKQHILPNGNKRMGLACFIVYFMNYPDNQNRQIIFDKSPKDISLHIARSPSSEKFSSINYLKKNVHFPTVRVKGGTLIVPSPSRPKH